MEAQIVKGSHVEETTLPTKDEKGKAQKIKSKSTMPYVIAELPKMRPFSLEGFCNYADIVINTFKNYEKLEVDADSTEEEKKKAKDFLIVTSHVRQIIENQQFEGAASGFLNANIIARKLGLADKQETKINTEQPLFGDN